MIRIRCENCGSKLNAKAKLAGQTRKCPQCGNPIVIPTEPLEAGETIALDDIPSTSSGSTPTPIVYDTNPTGEAIPAQHFPTRLNRMSRYLICDKQIVRAAWANDGRGWLLKISSGFSPAKTNRDALPAYGSFTLVELVMNQTDEGLRLVALEMYQLASRFAMPKLERNDDDICEAITARSGLNREQKASIYQVLRTLFMREVWGDSTEMIAFLLNADYHSHSSRGTKVAE